tara:strand:- start:191 stop:481 length:291 start_codon:yes stop_codon:yes gene_type:complete
MFDFIDPIQAKKNLNRQGTKVLHSIVEAYNSGALDDPHTAVSFCSLLATICEGKVLGQLDKEAMTVVWSLAPEYRKNLDKIASAISDENVIIGPWK